MLWKVEVIKPKWPNERRLVRCTDAINIIGWNVNVSLEVCLLCLDGVVKPIDHVVLLPVAIWVELVINKMYDPEVERVHALRLCREDLQWLAIRRRERSRWYHIVAV